MIDSSFITKGFIPALYCQSIQFVAVLKIFKAVRIVHSHGVTHFEDAISSEITALVITIFGILFTASGFVLEISKTYPESFDRMNAPMQWHDGMVFGIKSLSVYSMNS